MRRRRIIPAQELVDRAKNRKPVRPHIGGNYWYIVTKREGSIVLVGPFSDAREAEEIAMDSSKITTTYEIVAMDTRNRDEATRRLRYKMLRGNGGNLEDSLRRMKHTI